MDPLWVVLAQIGPFKDAKFDTYMQARPQYWETNKDLQNDNSDTYFFAYKIKTNYFMTKQVVWTFKNSFSYILIPSLLLNNKD